MDHGMAQPGIRTGLMGLWTGTDDDLFPVRVTNKFGVRGNVQVHVHICRHSYRHNKLVHD